MRVRVLRVGPPVFFTDHSPSRRGHFVEREVRLPLKLTIHDSKEKPIPEVDCLREDYSTAYDHDFPASIGAGESLCDLQRLIDRSRNAAALGFKGAFVTQHDVQAVWKRGSERFE